MITMGGSSGASGGYIGMSIGTGGLGSLASIAAHGEDNSEGKSTVGGISCVRGMDVGCPGTGGTGEGGMNGMGSTSGAWIVGSGVRATCGVDMVGMDLLVAQHACAHHNALRVRFPRCFMRLTMAMQCEISFTSHMFDTHTHTHAAFSPQVARNLIGKVEHACVLICVFIDAMGLIPASVVESKAAC